MALAYSQRVPTASGGAIATQASLSYAVVTPVRDEAESLPRLAACLASQTLLPERWVIVDNGSTDATFVVAERIAAEHGWVDVITVSGTTRPARGGQVVRAFCAGMAALGEEPDVVVKLDADVSLTGQVGDQRLLQKDAVSVSLQTL